MKKTFLIALLFVIAGQTAINAQHYGPLDTIPHRYKDYYYPEWYDECPFFCEPGGRFHPSYMSVGYGTFLRQNYTSRPMAVKGIAVMAVPENWDTSIYLRPIDTVRKPQYVFVYQWDPSQPDSLLLLDSARWDTITPRVMRFPAVCESVAMSENPDSIKYYYCYVYDCRFGQPLTVDSFFYIGGTNNGCNDVASVDDDHLPVPTNLRITYFSMRSDTPNMPKRCPMKYRINYWRAHSNMAWHYEPYEILDEFYGQFLAIVDNRYLNVYSADSTMGTVTGSGLFPDLSFDTIAAFPNPGYRFVQWNDGSTEPQRVIQLTQDTTFIAYFAENRDFFLQLHVNNEEGGIVTGQGIYPSNSTVTIRALANDGYFFDRWNDNVFIAERDITLTQDTSFTAYFFADTSQLGVVLPSDNGIKATLRPNPANGKVEITMDRRDTYTVEMLDARGAVVLRKTFDAISATLDIPQLPAGTYIVRIATNGGTAYKKLIVK